MQACRYSHADKLLIFSPQRLPTTIRAAGATDASHKRCSLITSGDSSMTCLTIAPASRFFQAAHFGGHGRRRAESSTPRPRHIRHAGQRLLACSHNMPVSFPHICRHEAFRPHSGAGRAFTPPGRYKNAHSPTAEYTLASTPYFISQAYRLARHHAAAMPSPALKKRPDIFSAASLYRTGARDTSAPQAAAECTPCRSCDDAMTCAE